MQICGYYNEISSGHIGSCCFLLVLDKYSIQYCPCGCHWLYSNSYIFMPLPLTLGCKGILFCSCPSSHLLSACSVSSFINTCFARCDISVLSGGISTKLGKSIHHVSGHCWIGLQGQKSASYAYKCMNAGMAEAYISVVWHGLESHLFYQYFNSGFPHLLESAGFFLKIFSSWKVLENEFGPGKYQKLKFKVPESPGSYLWFILTNMFFVSRTPCVNKCMKYSCYVLTEQFLCYLWTFCDGLYCHTVYTE